MNIQPGVELSSDTLPECGGNSAVVQWTVVHTHPSREKWASENLTRAGYETYLPLYATLAGKPRQLVERPLFPGYLFLGLETGQGWVAAWHTPGVHKLCMFAGRPGIAPTAAVEALQAGESARRCLPPPGSLWRPGAPCRLANGSPLDGIDAVVISVTAAHARVHVLMFGELREVAVRAECLVARKDV
jgi:transcriptional antiterminator RfaH